MLLSRQGRLAQADLAWAYASCIVQGRPFKGRPAQPHLAHARRAKPARRLVALPLHPRTLPPPHSTARPARCLEAPALRCMGTLCGCTGTLYPYLRCMGTLCGCTTSAGIGYGTLYGCTA
jgi:hypothetical protein